MKPKDNSVLTAWCVVSDLIQVVRWLPGISPAFFDSGQFCILDLAPAIGQFLPFLCLSLHWSVLFALTLQL